jgi:hypothetical protein
MITFQDIEQFIPFIKPLFDGLRSAKDFFHRDRRQSEHALEIPKQTLIIMPEARMSALWWGMGTANAKPAMQIVGDFQATNTSPYAIRISGIELLRPHNLEILMQMIMVDDIQTGLYGSKNLIPSSAIGELRVMFFIAPPVCAEGEIFAADLSFRDQFNNQHVLKGLQFRHIGPAQQP